MTNTLPLTEKMCDALLDREDYEGKELVEEDNWDADGKYQSKEVIFNYGGLTWVAYMSRSGSPFTDYEYDHPEEATQVQAVEKTITVWENV